MNKEDIWERYFTHRLHYPQDRFMQLLVHDLRAQAAAIASLSDMIVEDEARELSRDDVRKFNRVILELTDRLMVLLDAVQEYDSNREAQLKQRGLMTARKAV